MFYRSIRVIATLAISLAIGESFADPNATTSTEWNVETDTFATSLPEAVPTTMTARSCIQCAGINLQVTKDTKFFIGDTSVPLKELRQVAQKKHSMIVLYRPATSVVTRIVVQGVSSVAQ